MKISLPNSKKCSIASRPAASIAAAAALLVTTSAWASTPPTQKTLLEQIQKSPRSTNFQALLSRWDKELGPKAVTPLLAIAQDRHRTDRERYIAVMGAAKLGGPAAAEKISPLLKDKVWMIRTASLRALAVLKNPKTAKNVLPLLKDPALVVRMEAVESVRVLKPAGAAHALIRVLQSQANYRFGKAQWVPQRALNALTEIGDPKIVSDLRPLLDHRKDPALQRQAILTLESLTGRKMGQNLSLVEQIARWKKALAENNDLSRSG